MTIRTLLSIILCMFINIFALLIILTDINDSYFLGIQQGLLLGQLVLLIECKYEENF